jgi:hypothetical protein
MLFSALQMSCNVAPRNHILAAFLTEGGCLFDTICSVLGLRISRIVERSCASSVDERETLQLYA